MFERLPERLSTAAQCCSEVVERDPDRLIIAAQCSRDAVDSASKLNRVSLDRFVA